MKYVKESALVFFVLHVSAYNVSGQEANPSLYRWEEVLEELATNSEDEGQNWENELEELSDRIQEPLNLNGITKEQLEQFPFLNDIQIENILAYLYIHGQMQTIYELQLVEDMDKRTIEFLLPFVYVKPIKPKESLPDLKEVLKFGKNELLTRMDVPFYTRKGYHDSYSGTSVYTSLRYGFRYKDRIYAGITAEKDAGEPFFALHNSKGYDYYSFYFYMRNIRKLKTLAVGNYRLSFGRGLVISNDFMMGKNTSVSTITSKTNTIKKHSSTDEYNYFRGLATAVQWNDFIISAFYSHRSLDGIANENSISSIHKTGLHRTSKEVERHNAFAMQLTGGNITYSKNKLKLGITGIYYFFDKPYEPQIREYSKYNIRGNHFYNIGVDYKYRWKRFVFLGETAIGKSGGVATLNAINYYLSPNYQFMFIYRYYEHDYWAMFARSFSEGGYVQNENGGYFAVEAKPFRYWKFFVSTDIFAFPWLKYGIDKPSYGFEGTVQTTYSPRNNLSMFIRYRYKKKDKNYTENKVKTVRPLYHHRLRYQLNYSPSTHIAIRSVFDYNRINPQGAMVSQGFQFVQTLSYALPWIPLKVELHGAYFNTDDYSSRVYSYERGLLYAFYVPSYYGQGYRFMGHIRYDITKHWMVIVKYGQTIYTDRDEIGSGSDMIPGNKKSDMQLQLRVKF